MEDLTTNRTIRVVFFDIDGTLTSGGKVWAPLITSGDVANWRKLWLYGTGMPHYLASKATLVSQQGFRDRWVRLMAWLTTGWSENQVLAISQVIVDSVLIPNLRPDVVQILAEHRRQGHEIILISTMFSKIVEQLVKHLDAKYGLGSAVEIINGKSTGRIVGETCSGARKVTAAQRFLTEAGGSTTLDKCAGYADSRADTPLLSAVGFPVATYPDETMRATAIAHGWRIMPG